MFRDIDLLAARARKFYADQSPAASIQIRGISELSPEKMPPLNSFSFPADLEKYLELRAKNLEKYWERRSHLDDDIFPSIAPWYGIAEHTSFLGGVVDYTPDTSYNHTICPTWEDVEKLKLDPENPRLKMITDGIRYYRENWGDKFVPKLRGADGPSDIVNIVRGNEIFYDVYDEPEKVKALVDFCADAARFYLEAQKTAAGKVAGGYVTGFDIWLDGNSIGQLSEDASCMMSPDIFEELFLDGLKKTCAGYDSAMLHMHSLGKVMLPIFASVPQIKAIEISNDPNADRCFDVWRQYEKELAGKVVIMTPTAEELRANADIIKRNKCLIWYYAKTLAEAEDAVKFVRSL